MSWRRADRRLPLPRPPTTPPRRTPPPPLAAAAVAASRAVSRAALNAIIDKSPGTALSAAERSTVDRFAAGDGTIFGPTGGRAIDMTLNRFVEGGRTGRCVLRLCADMTWTTIRKFSKKRAPPATTAAAEAAAAAAAAEAAAAADAAAASHHHPHKEG